MTRRKKTKGSRPPLIRLVGLEAAVAATGLAGALTAAAAPGDLDPSFGDSGRQQFFQEKPDYQIFSEWSVDVQADDAVLLGGGGEYCYFGCYEDFFLGRLLPNGTPDASFVAAAPKHTWVRDTALQNDGKVIAVGDEYDKLKVFRLRPDGSLDPDFGVGGIVLIAEGGGGSGHSVIVDPDGRIVVAGTRGNTLLVARLLSNGALDASFGSGGIYLSTAAGGYGGYPTRIARAPGGGYRVMAHGPQTPGAGLPGFGCTVFGLTEAGVLDAGFGNAGLAPAPPVGDKLASCRFLAVQSDGRILLGGTYGGYWSPYVGRLLASGATDTGFHPDQATAKLTWVTALAVGSSGSIFVAGSDQASPSGASVVRMLADGTLDTSFGRAGVARVDVKARRAVDAYISDMKVTARDGLVLAGNASRYGGGVFAARLLGDGAGGSPGVLSLTQERVLGTEQGGRAVLAVRRTGGSQGAVAVSYSARDNNPPPEDVPYSPSPRATYGADYTAVTGRLSWADGDTSERQIEVPIASDTNTEPPEFFEVALESPEGGAGLGAYGADVEIAGASYPFGDLTIQATANQGQEGTDATFYVHRNYYSQGAVSVTVRVAAGGSATPGKDFHSPGKNDWQDVVLTWGDGVYSGQVVTVAVDRDQSDEPGESFTLELVSPTGGAQLGTDKAATLTILDPPPSPPPPGGGGSGGGGGSFGWLGAMLLGLGGALRRRLTGNRKPSRAGVLS